MKKMFESPVIEITVFEEADVITGSPIVLPDDTFPLSENALELE